MFKRELKINLRSVIIWALTCMGIFLTGFLVYPTMPKGANLDELLNSMPKEFMKLFNMDITSINNVFGWIKTEGNMFLLLITGVFASTLGASILLKEESEKTIEYLAAKPVTRNQIVTAKIFSGMLCIIIMNLAVTIFNYIGLTLSGEFNSQEYFILSFAPLLAALPLFCMSMLLATFFDKTKKTSGLSIGLVFLSYFLSVAANMSDKVNFLKYFSIYTLANSREIILNKALGWENLGIALGLLLLLMPLIYYRYNKKELV